MVDIWGQYRSKKLDADYFSEKVIKSHSAMCSYILNSDLFQNPIDGTTFANFSTGYGDNFCRPDLNSGREATYNGKLELMFISNLYHNHGHQEPHYPRLLAQQAAERLSKNGVNLKVSVDLEATLIDKNFRENFDNLHKLSFQTRFSNLHNSFYAIKNDELFEKIDKELKVSDVRTAAFEGREGHGKFAVKLPPQESIKACDDTLFMRSVKN